MAIDHEIREGREAENLLDHPVFKRAFETVESGLIAKMRVCAMADIDTQHELVLSLQLLGNVRRQIETIAQTGRMAQVQKETLAAKLKRFVR